MFIEITTQKIATPNAKDVSLVAIHMNKLLARRKIIEERHCTRRDEEERCMSKFNCLIKVVCMEEISLSSIFCLFYANVIATLG